MHFVVGVRVQAAEPVISVGIGKIAADSVGAQIFQEHDAIGQWVFRFVADDAAHGAQLRFFLGILGGAGKHKKKKQAEKRRDVSCVVHFVSPPFAGLVLSSLNVSRFCASAILATK